jgi:hypothetical protein
MSRCRWQTNRWHEHEPSSNCTAPEPQRRHELSANEPAGSRGRESHQYMRDLQGALVVTTGASSRIGRATTPLIYVAGATSRGADKRQCGNRAISATAHLVRLLHDGGPRKNLMQHVLKQKNRESKFVIKTPTGGGRGAVFAASLVAIHKHG